MIGIIKLCNTCANENLNRDHKIVVSLEKTIKYEEIVL